MKELVKKIPEIALVVLLLMVVSFNSDKIFCEEQTSMSDDTDSPFKISDVKAYFPKAVNIKELMPDHAIVKDCEGNRLGEILYSGPSCDDIIGYAGNVPMMIYIDGNKKILGLRLMDNVESPGFVRRIEKSGFFNSWDGMTADEAMGSNVDVVSGASMTSGAVKQSVERVLCKYNKKNEVKEKIAFAKILYYFIGILLLVFALLSFFKPAGYSKYRNILLVLSVLIFGFWQGNFISLTLLYGWFVNGVPLAGKLLILLIVILAFIIPLFTNKSFYCVYVCPYGAAQELAGKILKKKRSLPMRLVKILRKVKMVFFYLILLLLVLGMNPDLTEYEPFSAFLFNAATPWVICFALIFLVLSIFIPRPWCNYCCPTGYLLDIFRKGKEIKK